MRVLEPRMRLKRRRDAREDCLIQRTEDEHRVVEYRKEFRSVCALVRDDDAFQVRWVVPDVP